MTNYSHEVVVIAVVIIITVVSAEIIFQFQETFLSTYFCYIFANILVPKDFKAKRKQRKADKFAFV